MVLADELRDNDLHRAYEAGWKRYHENQLDLVEEGIMEEEELITREEYDRMERLDIGIDDIYMERRLRQLKEGPVEHGSGQEWLFGGSDEND